MIARIAGIAAILASPAFGVACNKTEIVYKVIQEEFGEVRIMKGVVGGDIRGEVWASAKGTWTFLVVNGIVACVILAGEDVVLLPPPMPGEPT